MQDGCSESKLSVDVLMPSVYEELRRLANRYLRGERPGHTLPPTALVHETYLRLASASTEWDDRLKFLAAAATAMRRILVDHARAQGRQKRGGRPRKVTLNETIAVGEEDLPSLLDVDEALKNLSQRDARKGRIIELIFFGGLTYDECAEILEISPVTLYRELKAAKAWLYRELAPLARPA